MPASRKALLMSLHFCCSGSEMVHHCTSITPSAAREDSPQHFLTQPARAKTPPACSANPLPHSLALPWRGSQTEAGQACSMDSNHSS